MNTEDVISDNWPDYRKNEDKQTSITQYGDNLHRWEIATTDYRLVRKLMKKGHQPTEESKLNGVVYFVLTSKDLTFRTYLTPEQRAARAKKQSDAFKERGGFSV